MINLPYPIPNNYRKNCRNSYPAYLRGFEHFFYANTSDLLNDVDFDNWVLGMYNQQHIQVQNFGGLVKDIITPAEFRFYKSFTIDSSMNTGLYYFVVYNSVTEQIKFISNSFELIEESMIENYTYLQYRNSTNQFNYNYESIPMYNAFFLELDVVEEQSEVSLTQVAEKTTGKIRNQKSQIKKVLTIESYYFDDGAHDSMLALSIHDDIFMNGKVVEVKEGYKIDSNKINSLQKGSILVYEQEVSTINLKG